MSSIWSAMWVKRSSVLTSTASKRMSLTPTMAFCGITNAAATPPSGKWPARFAPHSLFQPSRTFHPTEPPIPVTMARPQRVSSPPTLAPSFHSSGQLPFQGAPQPESGASAYSAASPSDLIVGGIATHVAPASIYFAIPAHETSYANAWLFAVPHDFRPNHACNRGEACAKIIVIRGRA